MDVSISSSYKNAVDDDVPGPLVPYSSLVAVSLTEGTDPGGTTPCSGTTESDNKDVGFL